MTSEVRSEADEVKRVIRRWGRAFGMLDPEGLLAVWDETYPNIMYQAEEFPDPIRGWDALSRYYRTMMGFAKNLRGQTLADLDVDVLGDVAWCYLRGGVTFDLPGMPTSLGGEARQSFLLRKVAGEWKIIHYHESRETPGLRTYLYDAHPNGDALKANDQLTGVLLNWRPILSPQGDVLWEGKDNG